MTYLPRIWSPLALLCIITCGVLDAHAAEPQSFDALGNEYARQVRPLLREFCLECHATAEPQGELDLQRFSDLPQIRRDPAAWLKVVEMLDNGEMPPKDHEPQPTAEQRSRLRNWARAYLDAEALANAGDPGPVVLRRLSNAEYTYTIRDLTGVALDPAREFPAASAAGEGFTNAGGALVMSPALLEKYFTAAKDVAAHAVLLPDGFRFSPSTKRGDWTNDILQRIRALYDRHAEAAGGSQVNLQGIVFATNEGGRLPIESYLVATLAEREALEADRTTIDDAARRHQLNPKYFRILWRALHSNDRSLVLAAVREKWRAAPGDDATEVVAEVRRWQEALWRFSSVGHIGKVGGPRAWQEPVTPVATQQELRWKLPASPAQAEAVCYLATAAAGDGADNDLMIWQQPRLVAPGRPEILLRDVGRVSQTLAAQRDRLLAAVPAALDAAAEVQPNEPFEIADLAQRHGLEHDELTAWLELLGLSQATAPRLEYLADKVPSQGGYDFVQGWATNGLPSLVANASGNHVRIPGNMKPHGVAVHPTPTLYVAVGWQSPLAGELEIQGTVTHAHPECGNGVTWLLELRRGSTRQLLAQGTAQGATTATIGPLASVAVQPGDLVSLLIGPRNTDHSCDLTDLELVLRETHPADAQSPREWNLTKDVSGDVLAGNPHADRLGNRDVWHFYSEPIASHDAEALAPAGSLLARWQTTREAGERQHLAEQLHKLLAAEDPPALPDDHPDRKLYHQLRALDGPLLRGAWESALASAAQPAEEAQAEQPRVGIDPALFGKHPSGQPLDAASLAVQAPSAIEVRLPTDLMEGAELVTTAVLDAEQGREGSVQALILDDKPANLSGLQASRIAETKVGGMWTSDNRRLSYAAPILVNEGTAARARVEAAFAEFRAVFPIALCYTKIVPVDEVVTLTLYHREDEHLTRLMLSEDEAAELDRLWEQLHFVSHDALTLVDAFEQILEYASQDADPKVFEPMREPIQARAAAFRAALARAEPQHVNALVDFAARAFRRPLTEAEQFELRALYQSLRRQDVAHELAFQLVMARILIAPAFLYRLEATDVAPAVNEAGDARSSHPGVASHPISDWELASRLSYFLWASMPDEALRAAAAQGTLSNPDELERQTRRMLQDPRMRRMATEFACQWLQVYEFDALDEKSETLFPEFAELRGDMYEEVIRFFTDMLQRDGSVLGVLDADHTFVNQRLAAFYGLPWDASAADQAGWQRVEGVRQQGRGGILGLGATLAKQSGASRTSPILRGTWISEVLLGDKLPNPPKDVPLLPDVDTASAELTVRQMVEKHSSDPRCASCHVRIDPYGFALERYDAIGRRRDRDAAGRPLDTRTQLPDGTEIGGMEDLRAYLRDDRRDVVLRQFCRKLLGYALGRGVQLSDQPLLTEMRQQLEENDYRLSAALLTIVRSRQFREIRSSSQPLAESTLE